MPRIKSEKPDAEIVSDLQQILDSMGLTPMEKAIVAGIATQAATMLVTVAEPGRRFLLVKAATAMLAHTVTEIDPENQS